MWGWRLHIAILLPNNVALPSSSLNPTLSLSLSLSLSSRTHFKQHTQRHSHTPIRSRRLYLSLYVAHILSLLPTCVSHQASRRRSFVFTDKIQVGTFFKTYSSGSASWTEEKNILTCFEEAAEFGPGRKRVQRTIGLQQIRKLTRCVPRWPAWELSKLAMEEFSLVFRLAIGWCSTKLIRLNRQNVIKRV